MAMMRAVILTLLLALVPFASLNFIEEESEFLEPSRDSFESSSTVGHLAWEWVTTGPGGPSGFERVFDVKVAPSGNVYAIGLFMETLSLPGCNIASAVDADFFSLFVAKFDANGTCIRINIVTSNVAHIPNTYPRVVTMSSLVLDSYENVYVSSSIYKTHGGSGSVWFANATSAAFTQTLSLSGSGSSKDGFVAKLNNNGTWDWATEHGIVVNAVDGGIRSTISIDSNGDIWAGFDSGILAKFNSTGVLQVEHNYGPSSNTVINDLAIDSSDNMYITGKYIGTFVVEINGVISTHPSAGWDMFVLKVDSNGDPVWFSQATSTSTAIGYSIAVDSNEEVYLAALYYSNLELDAQFSFSAGGLMVPQGIVGKLNFIGDWEWVNEIVCACTVEAFAIDVDSSGNVFVTGRYHGGTVSFGSVIMAPAAGSSDVFVVKYNNSGANRWAISAGSTGDDVGYALTLDNSGNLYVGGNIDGLSIFGTLNAPGTSGDPFVAKLSADYDGDANPDIFDTDDDNDFIQDLFDSCHYSSIGFQSVASLDHDGDGCRDSDEDDDDDNDNVLDDVDDCPKGMTGWTTSNVTDIDGDGCMDALEDFDDDADGFEDYEDLCPRTMGNSTFEFEKGCLDTDGDTRPDIRDPFPEDDLEWSDLDSDGTGDNSDEFPLDSTQISDADKDEFGDEEFGNNGDSCPLIFGTSTIDRRGCVDTDGDGWSDAGDDFPENPAEYLDTDGDTVPDHLDAFPFDPTQKQDTDGDGYGDNADGNLGDAFPNDPSRHADSDRDSYDDDSDAFPFDPTQWSDADGDEYGDNPLGLRPDAFPLESSQWSDVDGDGWGDNISGNHPDAFPTDITQWIDIDGDGYGDNPFGINPDAYPKDPTQWADFDEDGYGDNPNGTNPDPFVNDTDNDGYNNSIDPLPNIATPGDLDGDMCLDEMDEFPSNPNECKDSDGDGWGDNQDSDDDNDGVNDITEIQEGTDPMDASSVPVESFEIVVAGNIGLGAWDLIGIFGGVPFFTWLAFCLVTRGGRSRRYEKSLFESKSEEELSEISSKYEFALMLRLLGPHQALRLERVRSNLEVHFNEIERKIAADPDFNLSNEGPVMPPSIDVQGIIHTDGYEWADHMGCKWYRVPDTGSDWSRWQ